jgi:hypothetical protein
MRDFGPIDSVVLSMKARPSAPSGPVSSVSFWRTAPPIEAATLPSGPITRASPFSVLIVPIRVSSAAAAQASRTTQAPASAASFMSTTSDCSASRV